MAGARGAVALQSGTAGLHLALILAGIEAGDEVVVSDLTFVAAVHLYGQSAELQPILDFCRRYDLPLVEDAAEALGAKEGPADLQRAKTGQPASARPAGQR